MLISSKPVTPSGGSAHSGHSIVPRLVVGFCLFLACWFARADPSLDRFVQLASNRYGEHARQVMLAWRSIILEGASLSERERLELVNTFVNRNVGFAEDQLVWGQNDYWATPIETIGLGLGDCEDISIAKYVSLWMSGVPVERLRLTYVRAELGRQGSGITQAHMVVAYYETPDAEPIILDNLINDLRPASRRPDLTPVFGFNSEGMWVGGNSLPVLADPTSRLSRWRDVLRRMREEGLD